MSKKFRDMINAFFQWDDRRNELEHGFAVLILATRMSKRKKLKPADKNEPDDQYVVKKINQESFESLSKAEKSI